MAARNTYRKPPRTSPGRQILPLADKAQELSLPSVAFDPALAQGVRDEYNRQVAVAGRRNLLGLVSYGVNLATLGAIFKLACATGDPVFIAWVSLMGAGAAGAAAEPLNRTDGQMAVNAAIAQHKLRDLFRTAQIEAFETNQKTMIALADAHLRGGFLLDMKGMAYLAAARPHLLAQASDQLAISVYQARALLAHMREPENTEKPLAFADLEFNPASEKHRRFLLERLAGADPMIEEDLRPQIQELELGSEGLPRKKFGRGTLRALFQPLFLAADRKRYRSLSLPGLPEVAVAPLAPAENFALLLRRYEERNPRLDLPALRGWPRAAKALPRP